MGSDTGSIRSGRSVRSGTSVRSWGSMQDGERDARGIAGTATPALDAMERQGEWAYPPETWEASTPNEPDATTALLGGNGRRRRLARLGRRNFLDVLGTLGEWGAALRDRLAAAGGSRVLDYHVKVGRTKIPWALVVAVLLPWLLLFWLFSRRSGAPHLPLPLLSNGTHTFHPTTIIVSLDGVKPAYLHRNDLDLPHLRALAADGVSAEMTPVFPTLTFPNHWSILTGLYPSSHGIVANQFYRPGEGEFDYRHPESSWQGHWWRGEPAWSVAERWGRKTLNFMWPGPPTTASGVSPSFFVQYSRNTAAEKLAKLVHHLDMKPDIAPSLLFMYLPDADQAGHGGGPDSPKVTAALKVVDTFVGDLREEIVRRNMSHIVDLVVLSDHGMAQLSEQRLVFLDDILGDMYADIWRKDGWPTYGLWFQRGVDYAPHVAKLQEAARNGSFAVYTHDTMPERWHFAHADHIAPVYLVPDLGWLLTDHHEYDRHGLDVLGAHGYDNKFPDMHAVFFTAGPAAERLKARARGGADGWKSSSPAVMKSFANLEIFSLIARLQAYDPPAHNGTAGFWDRYFGST